MKLINFNNDDSFFTSEDKDNFNEIVGNSIEDLKKEILKQTQETINLIYKSDNKFVYNETLNNKGLHVYRSLLANRIYEERNYSNSKEVQSLNDKGYVIIDNFLSDKEFNKLTILHEQLKETYNGKRSGTSCIIGKKDLIKFWMGNPQYFQLIKECAHIKHLINGDLYQGYPQSKIQYLKHMPISDDGQKKMHSDVFYPIIKSWIYIEDIGPSQGAFEYVPHSNLYTKNRMIWDNENSKIKRGDKLWKRRVNQKYMYNNQGMITGIRIEGKHGAFRVYENSSEVEENNEIQRLGFNEVKSFHAPKNTLVIANTHGFHKRGLGTIGSFRSSFWTQYRPKAFGIY
tara:strand:- start:150 stop:1178 length:1029 start_codon:yes stop_codon:yes gene_type:complete